MLFSAITYKSLANFCNFLQFRFQHGMPSIFRWIVRKRTTLHKASTIMTNGSSRRIIPIPSLFFLVKSQDLSMRMHNVITIITNLLIWVKWFLCHKLFHFLLQQTTNPIRFRLVSGVESTRHLPAYPFTPISHPPHDSRTALPSPQTHKYQAPDIRWCAIRSWAAARHRLHQQVV